MVAAEEAMVAAAEETVVAVQRLHQHLHPAMARQAIKPYLLFINNVGNRAFKVIQIERLSKICLGTGTISQHLDIAVS